MVGTSAVVIQFRVWVFLALFWPQADKLTAVKAKAALVNNNFPNFMIFPPK
jgi:hypothetical protein